jgi:YNFM family putative membrane transporter
MAYVAEEVETAAIGPAIGLYISGTTVGGMAGRLGVSLIADYFGWRAGLAAIGALCLAIAALFWWAAPPSRGFVVRRHDWRSFAAGLDRLRRDAALPWLYLAAFLLMGSFVTIYNYAGFRLGAPPYGLSQSAVGAIFLLYALGTVSSAVFGSLAGRIGSRAIFWIPTLTFLIGLLVTAARPLPIVILGIGIATTGFFGAHSIASSWVSRRAGADRAQAGSFYLFFYYMGSSILGSCGGIAWSRAAWPGVVAFVAVLLVASLIVAGLLARVPPKPQPA